MQRFIYDDLKKIIQQIMNPKYYAEASKLLVYYGATDDPELIDILTDAVARQFRVMTIDDICTVLVNMAHTLTPNAQILFDMANQEFGQRMRTELDNIDPSMTWRPDHLLKTATVLLEHRQMKGEFKLQMIEHIEMYRTDFDYDVRADLAVLFATKMDDKYRDQFFDKFLDSYLKDMKYLDQDTLYKILWAFIKADRLKVNKDIYEW